MLQQLFGPQRTVERHRSAPFVLERERYLAECLGRGSGRGSLVAKAQGLYRIAHGLSAHRCLSDVTSTELDAAVYRSRPAMNFARHTQQPKKIAPRDFRLATEWIWFLKGGPKAKSMPFADELETYCRWALDDCGYTEATVNQSRWHLTGFLFWYFFRNPSLSLLHATDIDDYIRHCGGGWGRRTMKSVATILRMFVRFTTSRGWTRKDLAGTIHAPRVYADESLPSGIDWQDVQRLFASLDPANPTDVRDRAILMLMAIYALRVSEVASLSLDDLDWDRNLLLVSHCKRRDRQALPLSPSMRDALADYLTGRRSSGGAARRVFLTVSYPYRPMSKGALCERVAQRLTALDIKVVHRGPHCLRHACAARLVAEGLTLKEIGDHLGHRSTRSTRIYAKVDLAGLRQVAAFDLGDVL